MFYYHSKFLLEMPTQLSYFIHSTVQFRHLQQGHIRRQTVIQLEHGSLYRQAWLTATYIDSHQSKTQKPTRTPDSKLLTTISPGLSNCGKPDQTVPGHVLKARKLVVNDRKQYNRTVNRYVFNVGHAVAGGNHHSF